ncbi:LysR substrate-binding domain-containing protein [Paraburkholderia tropica]|uniref:LysR substrate-binding domain-containing protein n=1 Tax=Paraburkholderia tropica TaxID=92647 RepID=UPI002AB6BF81|nr:LysR substrate-binding domain-containing protein [Paraburkholderia tropica]
MPPPAFPPEQSGFPSVDVDLLRTFIAIAETQSYSAAGVRIGKTQSAVSQQMQRLEQQLNCLLFERTGRTKQLSEQGRRLMRYAYQLVAMHDETVRVMHYSVARGNLRIGAPFDVAESILPLVLRRIVDATPNIDVEITIEHSDALMEALSRAELDMILSTRESGQFEGFVLRASPIVWCAAADYQWDRRTQLPLIIADGPSLFAKYAIAALETAGIPWRQAFLSSNLVAIKSAIYAGLGVTARGTDILTPNMRLLGREDGMPPLPSISYHLWIRPNALNPLIRQTYQLIRHAFNAGAR